MMIAVVASRPKVTGMSSDTAAAGPNPGRTPTSIPRMQPISAKRRLWGVRTVEMPPSSASMPMSDAQHRQREQPRVGEGRPQPDLEHEPRGERDGQSHD